MEVVAEGVDQVYFLRSFQGGAVFNSVNGLVEIILDHDGVSETLVKAEDRDCKTAGLPHEGFLIGLDQDLYSRVIQIVTSSLASIFLT